MVHEQAATVDGTEGNPAEQDVKVVEDGKPLLVDEKSKDHTEQLADSVKKRKRVLPIKEKGKR
jgi:hypothetical protein